MRICVFVVRFTVQSVRLPLHFGVRLFYLARLETAVVLCHKTEVDKRKVGRRFSQQPKLFSTIKITRWKSRHNLQHLQHEDVDPE